MNYTTRKNRIPRIIPQRYIVKYIGLITSSSSNILTVLDYNIVDIRGQRYNSRVNVVKNTPLLYNDHPD
ncbi:hypothetical protein ACK8P5_18575 [Paenibacillus sp. EC2-1]|uniref:hypothetical protein n=1 Tax=Paenibacillus sp. EC2-1 TaxID=3388665 RepID=UPI003BEF2C46